MARIVLIISAVMVLQSCINAAPNTDIRSVDAVEESPKEDDPKLDSQPYEASEDANVSDDRGLQGQRQKRFNEYFNFGFSPYGLYNPNFIKRDDSQNTGIYDASSLMSQILRRVQIILGYTRQQARPPPAAPYHLSFTPLLYIPYSGCGCTPAETPSNGEESSNDSRPTQPTTSSPPAERTTQAISTDTVPGPSVTDDTNINIPDFSTRSDTDDGSRPISFVPIKPKTPLSRPPPPVEHGSVQASREDGNQQAPISTTTVPPVVTGLPPQPHLPTNSIPTLCDAAVITCCHRPEVTYDCFKSQGCPYPTSPDNPCDANIIVNVIRKFQYYYANRRA